MCRKTPLNACIAVWTLTQLKSQIIKNVSDSWRCEMKFRDINSCSCCPLATHGTQILRYGGRDQTEQIHESFHDHFYWCILNEEQREVLFSLRMWKDFLLDEHTKNSHNFHICRYETWNTVQTIWLMFCLLLVLLRKRVLKRAETWIQMILKKQPNCQVSHYTSNTSVCLSEVYYSKLVSNIWSQHGQMDGTNTAPKHSKTNLQMLIH